MKKARQTFCKHVQLGICNILEVEENMSYQQTVSKWFTFEGIEPKLKTQLEEMKDKESLLEDAFYKNLEFGTGGMRGELGPGTNRMNVYTIRKASLGFAYYIKSFGGEAKKRGVVIAYDCRHNSDVFALEAAKTLATEGIKTYIFKNLRPTPELSFAVRELNAFGGIVITASHNPPEYNGFKVYGEDGAQHPPVEADKIISYVNSIQDELTIPVTDEVELENKGLITWIESDIDEAYLSALSSVTFSDYVDKDISIVFTSLHGTAVTVAPEALKRAGYTNVHLVEKQCIPDSNFSTVKSPNPEEHSAFKEAIALGKEVNGDVLIATDPDADRLGIAVKDQTGEYRILTGNQTGGLFLDYILRNITIPQNAKVFKTIVTSEFGRAVANHFSVETEDVLTGFKFIAEKIKQLEDNNSGEFLFGYEESYGYLIKDFARDKDAIQAVLLAAEVAGFYKKRNMTMYEGLVEAFEKYGFYLEGLHSVTLKGKEGTEIISSTMNHFRKNPITKLNGHNVEIIEDYETSVKLNLTEGSKEEISLPKSNVIKFICDNGAWVCLRPSGTEPKIKFYFGVCENSLEQSVVALEQLKEDFINKVEAILNANR